MYRKGAGCPSCLSGGHGSDGLAEPFCGSVSSVINSSAAHPSAPNQLTSHELRSHENRPFVDSPTLRLAFSLRDYRAPLIRGESFLLSAAALLRDRIPGPCLLADLLPPTIGTRAARCLFGCDLPCAVLPLEPMAGLKTAAAFSLYFCVIAISFHAKSLSLIASARRRQCFACSNRRIFSATIAH